MFLNPSYLIVLLFMVIVSNFILFNHFMLFMVILSKFILFNHFMLFIYSNRRF